MILRFKCSAEIRVGANEGRGPFAPEDGGHLNQPFYML